jgi:hypothetical protein
MYCKCGKIWNKTCEFASLTNVNAYESKWSFEQMMRPGHESGFYEMTPDQRRKYTTSGRGMIKSSVVHLLECHVSEYTSQPPSIALQPSAPYLCDDEEVIVVKK